MQAQRIFFVELIFLIFRLSFLILILKHDIYSPVDIYIADKAIFTSLCSRT